MEIPGSVGKRFPRLSLSPDSYAEVDAEFFSLPLT